MNLDTHRPLTLDAVEATSILVVGDAMLDRYWFGEVDRISPEAPVPIVHVQREEFRLGGAANVARNVRALGARATLLSAVGADEAGRKLSGILAENGIGSALKLDPELSTTVKLRVSGRQQQLLRIDFERRPAEATLAAMAEDFEALVAAHDAVIFSDYGKGALGSIAAMIARSVELGVPIFVDPKGRDYEPYRGATLITPNRTELMQVTGGWSNDAELSAKAAALRAQLDVDALLLTRSEEGMSLFDRDGELRVVAEAREVFDVTGAGDTVIAVMSVLVAAGVPLRDAVPLANRAGAVVVAKFGTASVSYDDLFGPVDTDHEDIVR